MIIKPWYLAPVAAIVAVAASAFWWDAEKARWTPPPPRKPDLPKVDPMPVTASARITQALERPLLWTSRRPVAAEEKKSSMVNELMQARLTAVFESGADRVAILQRADGTTLKITGETKPWRVDSFDGRKAIFLSADNQRVERPLEAGSPAAASDPRAAAAAERVRRPALRP